SSYTPSSATVGTTYYYVVVGSDCGSDVSSSAVGVTITENTAIATQPVGASYCQSASVTDLSVSATGTGTLTYQWYSNTSNSNTGGTL
ncbi:hypothetical protein, partial [Acinetobacter genomosp. 33YU]|uniref:hypothetical protein n=1 Tax=Acinetobacter genomosp. 33YU TaxID=1675530 RepID=UPI001BB465CD